MSRFFEAAKRYEEKPPTEPSHGVEANEGLAAPVNLLESAKPLTRIPPAPAVPANLARTQALRAISERVAPLAEAGPGARLVISGCRPGDGVSSVAAGMALDLSQRLGLRTLLLDAHLRHPSLFRAFATGEPMASETEAFQLCATRWPRLEVACCSVRPERENQAEFFSGLEELLARFPASIIDLGVMRLDARMLPLVRPGDPVLLVVRYGSTERRELAATTAALGAGRRTAGGVILNAKVNVLPRRIRRLLGTGAE